MIDPVVSAAADVHGIAHRALSKKQRLRRWNGMPFWKEFLLNVPATTSGAMMGMALAHKFRGDDTMPEFGLGALGAAGGAVAGRQWIDNHPESFAKQMAVAYGAPIATGSAAAILTHLLKDKSEEALANSVKSSHHNTRMHTSLLELADAIRPVRGFKKKAQSVADHSIPLDNAERNHILRNVMLSSIVGGSAGGFPGLFDKQADFAPESHMDIAMAGLVLSTTMQKSGSMQAIHAWLKERLQDPNTANLTRAGIGAAGGGAAGLLASLFTGHPIRNTLTGAAAGAGAGVGLPWLLNKLQGQQRAVADPNKLHPVPQIAQADLPPQTDFGTANFGEGANQELPSLANIKGKPVPSGLESVMAPITPAVTQTRLPGFSTYPGAL